MQDVIFKFVLLGIKLFCDGCEIDVGPFGNLQLVLVVYHINVVK